MTCTACDALAAKGKKCWRHSSDDSQIDPISNKDRGLLDTKYPSCVPHRKTAMPMTDLMKKCSCGAFLELSPFEYLP